MKISKTIIGITFVLASFAYNSKATSCVVSETEKNRYLADQQQIKMLEIYRKVQKDYVSIQQDEGGLFEGKQEQYKIYKPGINFSTLLETMGPAELYFRLINEFKISQRNLDIVASKELGLELLEIKGGKYGYAKFRGGDRHQIQKLVSHSNMVTLQAAMAVKVGTIQCLTTGIISGDDVLIQSHKHISESSNKLDELYKKCEGIHAQLEQSGVLSADKNKELKDLLFNLKRNRDPLDQYISILQKYGYSIESLDGVSKDIEKGIKQYKEEEDRIQTRVRGKVEESKSKMIEDKYFGIQNRNGAVKGIIDLSQVLSNPEHNNKIYLDAFKNFESSYKYTAESYNAEEAQKKSKESYVKSVKDYSNNYLKLNNITRQLFVEYFSLIYNNIEQDLQNKNTRYKGVDCNGVGFFGETNMCSLNALFHKFATSPANERLLYFGKMNPKKEGLRAMYTEIISKGFQNKEVVIEGKRYLMSKEDTTQTVSVPYNIYHEKTGAFVKTIDTVDAFYGDDVCLNLLQTNELASTLRVSLAYFLWITYNNIQTEISSVIVEDKKESLKIDNEYNGIYNRSIGYLNPSVYSSKDYREKIIYRGKEITPVHALVRHNPLRISNAKDEFKYIHMAAAHGFNVKTFTKAETVTWLQFDESDLISEYKIAVLAEKTGVDRIRQVGCFYTNPFNVTLGSVAFNNHARGVISYKK